MRCSRCENRALFQSRREVRRARDVFGLDGSGEGSNVPSARESAAGNEVAQEAVGTKRDRSEVGFQSGPGVQFLVFPKSLTPFAGRTVVGIKYDLISSPEVPKSERAKPPRPPKKPKPKPARKTREEKVESPPKHNVVAFKHRRKRRMKTMRTMKSPS